MPTIADVEALHAIKKKWDAESTLGGAFGQLLTGGIVAKAKKELLPNMPYALATSEKFKDSEYNAPVQIGSGYNNYRRVQIIGYGDESDMQAMARAIEKKLLWLPRDNMTLDFPTDVNFVVLRPIDEPNLRVEEQTSQGKDVYRCDADMVCWTTRPVGGQWS